MSYLNANLLDVPSDEKAFLHLLIGSAPLHGERLYEQKLELKVACFY